MSSTLNKIAVPFIILTLIIIILIVFLLIGKAEIILTSSIKPVQTNFDIIIKQQIENQDNQQLLGEIFQKEISMTETFQILNAKKEQLGKAHGNVVIINNHNKDQTLIATTRFLTPDDILFRLDKTVVVPSGQRLTAEITADKEGSTGDIQAPLRLIIPGLRKNLQDKIYGEIEKPFTGGVVKLGKLTEEDLNMSRQVLSQKISEQAQVEYLTNYLTQVSTTTAQAPPELLINLDILSESSSAQIGELTSEFDLTLDAQVAGVAYSQADLIPIAQNKLIASLPDGEKFVSIDPSSLEAVILEIDFEKQEAVIEVEISGESLITQDSGTIDKAKLIGKSKAELIEYFAEFSGIDKVQVNFSPFWINHVPRLISNINIIIQETGQ